MLQLWMQENLRRGREAPLKLVGILPNMFRKTTLHKDMLQSLQEDDAIGRYVMPCKLSQRIAFAEVDSEDANPRTIFDYPNANPAKQEALGVCEIIYKRIFEDD